MLKPKLYSLQEIQNAAHINIEASFYTNKEDAFIIDELQRATSRNIAITNRKDVQPSHSNIILFKEYEAKKPFYKIKTAFYDYPTISPLLQSICEWINTQAKTDYSTHLKLGLAFNNNHLQTLYSIGNMNIRKLILRINEDFIYDNFPEFKNSAWSSYVKKIIPNNNFINPDSILEGFVSGNFSVLEGEKYSIDFTKYTHGILNFNYIGGNDYAKDYNKVKNVCEYLISETYNVLNESNYTKEELNEIEKLTRNYRKYINLYNNPIKLLKEFKDLSISIDLKKSDELTKTYWNIIREPLFRLMTECDFKKGFFNYDSESGKFQIKNAKLNNINFKGLEFYDVECSGVFENCDLYRCKVTKGNFNNCILHYGNKISESYLNNCTVGNGTLEKCFVRNNEEIINADIKDSIIISGLIGHKAKVNENSVIIENPNLGLFSEKLNRTPNATGIISSEKSGIDWIKNLDKKINKVKIKYQ